MGADRWAAWLRAASAALLAAGVLGAVTVSSGRPAGIEVRSDAGAARAATALPGDPEGSADAPPPTVGSEGVGATDGTPAPPSAPTSTSTVSSTSRAGGSAPGRPAPTLPPQQAPTTTTTAEVWTDLLPCLPSRVWPEMDDPPPAPYPQALSVSVPIAVRPVEQGSSMPIMAVHNCRPVVGDEVWALLPLTALWGMLLQTGSIDWGDGSPRYDPGASVCDERTLGGDGARHRYLRPGRYLVRAEARACDPEVGPLPGITHYRVWVDVTAPVVPQLPGTEPCRLLGPALPGEPAREGLAAAERASPVAHRPGPFSLILRRCAIALGRQVHVGQEGDGTAAGLEVDWGDGSPRAVGHTGYNHRPTRKGAFVVTAWPMFAVPDSPHRVRGAPSLFSLHVH